MPDFTTLTSGLEKLTATPTGTAGQALNSNFILLDNHLTATGTAVHGLGTASTHAASDFDTAGSAATVNTSLTSHAAATGTAVHGLGTAATHAATDFLTPTGNGSQLTGIVATASPAGSTGQLQYNGGGSTAGDAATTDGAGNITVTSLTLPSNGPHTGDGVTQSGKVNLIAQWTGLNGTPAVNSIYAGDFQNTGRSCIQFDTYQASPAVQIGDIGFNSCSVIVNGTVSAGNISGSFTGSGSGLTSLPAAGSNHQLQYNNAGTFGGDSATTDGSGNLTVTSISGNGSGLSGLTYSQLSSPPAVSTFTNDAGYITGTSLSNIPVTAIDWTGNIVPNLNLDGMTVQTSPTTITFNGSVVATGNLSGTFTGSVPWTQLTGVPAFGSAAANATSDFDAAGTAAAITPTSLGLGGGISTTLNWLDGDGVTNHSLTISNGIITAAS